MLRHEFVDRWIIGGIGIGSGRGVSVELSASSYFFVSHTSHTSALLTFRAAKYDRNGIFHSGRARPASRANATCLLAAVSSNSSNESNLRRLRVFDVFDPALTALNLRKSRLAVNGVCCSQDVRLSLYHCIP